MNTTEEFQTAGAALLAMFRPVMTGKEIEACEWTQSAEFEEDSDFEMPEEPDKDDYTLNQEDEYEDDYAEWEADCRAIEKAEKAYDDSTVILKSLHVQFYAEITGWIDEQQRTASRLAVETHNRLHSLELIPA